jgi:hypothetical protein
MKNIILLFLLLPALIYAQKDNPEDTTAHSIKSRVCLNIGAVYPLLNLNNMGDNTDKYRITSATPRVGFAIGISKAPIPVQNFRFVPECYLRYYRDILKMEDNNTSSHSLFEEELQHTDLFLGFGANVVKNISKNDNINIELGLAFELQVTPTVVDNGVYFQNGVLRKDKDLLYLMPVRCCAKIGISKIVSSKYLIRINTDIPLLLLPKLTDFKQNFIQCSLGYIFK